VKRTFVSALSAASLFTTVAYAEEKEPRSLKSVVQQTGLLPTYRAQGRPLRSSSHRSRTGWKSKSAQGRSLPLGQPIGVRTFFSRSHSIFRAQPNLWSALARRSTLHLAAQRKSGSNSPSISFFGRGQIELGPRAELHLQLYQQSGTIARHKRRVANRYPEMKTGYAMFAHEAAPRVSLALQSRMGLNLSEIDNILTTVGMESDL
jgi:hypothetical protein